MADPVIARPEDSPVSEGSPPPLGTMTTLPSLHGVAGAISQASRSAFRYANRYGMVPFHRAGLAAWLGSPLTGWQCLLTTVGRRSGLRRHTPVGYIVMDDAAWVMAGYGPQTHWYRNLLDEPHVELRLPSRRPIAARAQGVRDPGVRARVIPALCRSMALPGAMIGCFPVTSTDERILECVSWVPLVRLAPADGSALHPGPDDPGGHAWLWRQAVALGATLLAMRAARWLVRVVAS